MNNEKLIKSSLFWLIFISTILRCFISFLVELSNDEVYYLTYAIYPALSHFDHPPMVGLIIRLFTFNLLFTNEFYIRLGAIILGSINTYVIFLVGKQIKDSLTGFYSAALYTASIYCSIICGTFIMPDSPMLFFWMLSLYFIFKTFSPNTISSAYNLKYIIPAGITIGLALLSKYQAAFLWSGLILFIFLFDRKLLGKWQLYISIFISFILFIPVIWWNFENQFINFSFHSNRMSFIGSPLRIDYFLTEIIGEILYNNPVIFFVIFATIFALFKSSDFIEKKYMQLLLCISLPLIFIIIIFSFFSRTLPHWTGPAYLCLILIAASRLSSKQYKTLIPLPIKISLILVFIFMVLGVGEVNYGFSNSFTKVNPDITQIGKNNVTLDMYGWKQIGKKFSIIVKKDILNNQMKADAPLISHKWFPAAHLDHYIAAPLNKKLFVLGDMDALHKYYWINKKRGSIAPGDDAYFINLSSQYINTYDFLKNYFNYIIPTDTIKVYRNGKIVKLAFVYKCKDAKVALPISKD